MVSTKQYSLGVVGTCGLPAAYGGFETLAEALVSYLASPTYKILVFAQQGYSRLSEESWDQFVVPLKANGASSIVYDICSLIIASPRCDCVLLLGVSGAISLPFLRLFFPKVKYIVHIDGLEWLRPKWGATARHFLRFSERLSIHFCDAFIVDNLGIADYVSHAYGKRYLKRASLLAYGTSLAQEDLLPATEITVVHACTGESLYIDGLDYLLVLGRAEPENNFEMIIEAYDHSGLAASDIRLFIVSNALTTPHGRDLLLRYSHVPGLFFACPEYDFRKVRVIRLYARAYVHGHSAGGTNPSLVEAIAAAKPIFAFDVPYNRYTTAGIASYFDCSVALALSLQKLIEKGLDSVPELRNLAKTSYDWDNVTRDYYALFGVVVRGQQNGISTLMGRIALRAKRKIVRMLLRLLYLFRHSRVASSRKHERRLPGAP